MMTKGRNRLFVPDLRKLIVSVALAILLWFFPLVTSSVYAVPFTNIESFWGALLINLAIAYLVSCLVVQFWTRKGIVVMVIALFLLLYAAVPKVSFYSVGDIGGTNEKYCECYGKDMAPLPKCCYSSVSYCMGPCLRNEWMMYWDSPEALEDGSPAQACKAQGGAWDATFGDRGTCLMQTIDGNASCTDSSECEGFCVGPEPGLGRCAEWEPMSRGCYDVLSNNTASRLCID